MHRLRELSASLFSSRGSVRHYLSAGIDGEWWLLWVEWGEVPSPSRIAPNETPITRHLNTYGRLWSSSNRKCGSVVNIQEAVVTIGTRVSEFGPNASHAYASAVTIMSHAIRRYPITQQAPGFSTVVAEDAHGPIISLPAFPFRSPILWRHGKLVKVHFNSAAGMTLFDAHTSKADRLFCFIICLDNLRISVQVLLRIDCQFGLCRGSTRWI